MSLRDMIITSQLQPPDRRRGVLHRSRLEKRLARVVELPLTLVQAGTGYGKSTALAMLARLTEEDIFWYTISEPERDPLLFLAHLLAAFDQGSRPWGRPFLQQLEESGGRATPSALTFLLNTLTTNLTRDAVLVLDDYHLVADVPEVTALVERLVDYRPPHLHVVLSSRQTPVSPALTRWRVKGQVLTIDRTELAFTVDEIAALFQEQYGLALTPAQAASLAAETEGWAIALQMIGQQLQESGANRLEEVLARLPSAMEGLFEYLALEVLARQPEKIQHFLLSCAVLRQMSGPACDALTERTNSTALLRRLRDSGLFITSVEAEVYRFQHLFHDFLLARLNQEPGRAQSLHRLAAAFFQTSGNPEESIYHLLEAGDLDQAAGQIETLGPALLEVGRLDGLTGWINRLPPAVNSAHPRLRLLLGDALRLRSQFDEAIAEYQAAEQLYLSRSDQLGRSQALRSQAQVYLDTVRPLKANSLLEEALRLLEPQEHPSEVAGLLEQLAENHLNLGQPAQAQALHQEARLLRAEADPSDFYLEARALLRTGRLAEAQRLLEEHDEAAGKAVLRPQRFHRETPLLLSLVCIMQGEARLAERYARQGMAIGERLESPFVQAVALMRIGHSLQLSQALPWTLANQRKAEEAYQKAIELVRPFKVTRVQVEPLWGLCRLAGYQGDLAGAMRYALPAIEIAEQAGDLWFASLLRIALGASLLMAGQTETARPWLEAARSGLWQAGDQFGWSAATLWLALGAWWQGNVDEAIETLGALLGIVRVQGYAALLTHCTHLGLKDNQAALPLLVEAQRRGVEPVYLDELLGHLGLSGLDYHPGYSLVVRTLGPFEAWRGAQAITPRDWQREKARQLFQFLLTTRGQWLAREQIVDRLWPYLDADAGGQNFKVALNALNHALEPGRPAGAAPFFVIRHENTYALNPLAHILHDASHFERAAGSAQPDDLRRALDIYEDDYLADSLGEEWAEVERERLRGIYLTAAGRLAEHCLAAGAADEALTLAGKMLERDRAWEEAYRLLMRAYAAQGSRAQVQAAYNRCAAALTEELDVAPSAETKALMEELIST
jgi:LuxR family transcriptional regulator, maltose regulon positive regulatory protein